MEKDMETSNIASIFFQESNLETIQEIKGYLLDTKRTLEKNFREQLHRICQGLETEKNIIRIKAELESVKESVKIRYTSFQETIEARWRSLFPKDVAQINESEAALLEEVDDLLASLCGRREYDVQKRWLEFGMPESMLSSHPECVLVLMKSGLARLIAMYRNTTQKGPENHTIRFDVDGEPLIKMQGQWTRWQTIASQMTIDTEPEMFVSSLTGEKWMYRSPDGLVPVDRFSWKRNDFGVEKLDSAEYHTLRMHAEKFWETNEEIDPQVDKPCIFQLFSTYRNHDHCTAWLAQYVPKDWVEWLTKNLVKNAPVHIGMRIIDAEGTVSSFGLLMPKEEEKVIFENMPQSFLTTTIAKLPLLDYEESRPQFDCRRVTSIPMSEKRKEALLEWLHGMNEQGIAFNFGKQNCCKVAQEAAKIVGVAVDTKDCFSNFLWNILPTFSEISFVGSPVVMTLHRISSIASPFFTTLVEYTPQTIQQAVTTVCSAIGTISSRVRNVACGLFLWMLGGRLSSPSISTMQREETQDNDASLGHFKMVIRSWYDLLDDKLLSFYHSLRMIEWQQRQPTTVEYTGSQTPKMYILP